MEPEGSFPYSQQPATGPIPVVDEYGLHPPILFNTNFNIILLFTPSCHKRSLSFGFSKLVRKVYCSYYIVS
jgi:hypothetical protein